MLGLLLSRIRILAGCLTRFGMLLRISEAKTLLHAFAAFLPRSFACSLVHCSFLRLEFISRRGRLLFLLLYKRSDILVVWFDCYLLVLYEYTWSLLYRYIYEATCSNTVFFS